MKKLLNLFFAIVLVGAFTVSYPSVAEAQMKTINKQREKKYKSLYKDKVNELKKGGWKIAGSTKTLEVALLDHYEKLFEDGNQEMVGGVSRCKSNNVGRQRAIANAQNNYASLAAGNIKGRVTSDIEATDDVEMERFFAAYEKYVKTNVGSALTPSFSVVRDHGDGTKEYNMFFINNDSKAAAARERAFKQAAKDVEMATSVADKISEFINEDFPVED